MLVNVYIMQSTHVKYSSLLPLYLVIFIGFVGYSLMITLFTPMLMYAHAGMVPADSSTAYRVFILGILLALYPLGQFFGSPVLGALSDHFGRKPVLLVSLYVTTLCYALIATALSFQNLSLLLISSLLAGVAESNIAIAQSAIADVSRDEERNRLFGYIYLSASAAYIIGPLLGGKLADPTLVSWFNYATPFWTVFALLLCTVFWIIWGFKETKKKKSREKIHYIAALSQLWEVFTARRLRLLYLINFLLYFSIFGFFRCYPMYIVDEYHIGVSKLSEYIAWVAVPIVLANLGITGFLSKRFSPKVLTISSAVMTAVFMLIILLPSSPNALWGTLFLTAFGLAICLPSCATMISLTASSEEQGKVMGNNQSLQVGAEASSAFIGGLLAAVKVKLPLVVLALIALFAVVLLLASKKNRAT